MKSDYRPRVLRIGSRVPTSSWRSAVATRLASLAAFVLLMLLPGKVAAWPTSMQPAVWLDQPVFFALSAGLGLLVLATIGWILLYRFSSKTRSGKDRNADFWLRLVQTTAKAATFDELLSSCLHVVAEKYGADRGMVSKYSQRSGHLFRVETFGQMQGGPGVFAEGEVSESIFRPCISGRRAAVLTDPTDKSGRIGRRKTGTTWLAIPIIDRYQTLAVMALAGGEIQPAKRRLLCEAEAIGKVICRGAVSFLSTAVGGIYRESAQLTRSLARILPACADVKEALGKMVQMLTQLCPIEFISLSRSDPRSGDEVRWSALVDKDRLVEWHYPILYGREGDALRTRNFVRPIIDFDLSGNPRADATPENRRGMRSRLILPLVYGDKPIARLTIAHRRPGQYDDATLVRLEGIVRVFAEWLHVMDTQLAAHRMDRYLDVLDRIDDIEQDKKDDMIAMLRRAMEVTSVHLFGYDPDQQTFSLVASSSVRPTAEAGLSRMHTPAERLPWHRYSIHSRQPCLIDQSDPEMLMSGEESRWAMIDRFKTGLLVPVHHQERNLGILTVAEMRHPVRRRFEGPDYVFLRCAASRIGEALGGNGHRSSTRAEMPDSGQTIPLLSAPLTTLYSSVDLIRQHDRNLDEQTNRYLTNIENAAERIKQFARDHDASSVRERSKLRRNVVVRG